ncbi:uncharacterized protein LOC119113256 [Pollicipes pollicipes]|uniref:uncharacterized protein LOC119113256 n=1 Tax=Pollicipes pollicipes TaxID=41117 RepID=UPI0018859CB2|nr:uncharacterized protein LOC119113256 [Pollicipes pollicipes]
MRAFLLFAVLIGGSLACQNRLETLVQEASGGAPDLSTDVRDECNARVGTFNSVHAPQYKKVINKALKLALQYMSISSHFGRDTNHRLGFQKLFKSASDERFEQAVSMIKYVVKRGGTMHQALNVKLPTTGLYNPLPLPSLGLALTDAKDMYEEQARLHRGALCLTATAGGMLKPAARSTPIWLTRLRTPSSPRWRGSAAWRARPTFWRPCSPAASTAWPSTCSTSNC